MDVSVGWNQVGTDDTSCIPSCQVIPSGSCEMCYWDFHDLQYSAHINMPKYRGRRNAVLDCIDKHLPLDEVAHIAGWKRGNILYVCRHCWFLLRQTGRKHFRAKCYRPLG